MLTFICQKCKSKYSPEEAYRCKCGGLFTADFECLSIDFAKLDPFERTIWRYIDSMPFENSCIPKLITMGEGFTPLALLEPGNGNLMVKCDYLMPTLSFKDRGAAVLIAYIKKMGVKKIVCDSSGNAGTAIAAYSARAGIGCEVFISDRASDKKVQQIRAHNAIVHKVPGLREAAAGAAIRHVEETGVFFASHIFNPLFFEGTKTYFFEVYEQLGRMPDGFIIPVGNGTLLFGALRAFEQMLEWGVIDKIPELYLVQAGNCAPVYKAFSKGEETVAPVENMGTLAEGIAIADPVRGDEILKALRLTNGHIISVTDEEILLAQAQMSALGYYTEITSAANYAGYKKYAMLDPEIKEKVIVMPISGSGIKSIID